MQDDTTQVAVRIAEYMNDYFVGYVGPTLARAIPVLILNLNI